MERKAFAVSSGVGIENANGQALPAGMIEPSSSPRRAKSGRPTCTVVIPTHDRPDALDRCLAEVSKLDYDNFDVLVVDNAPSDDQAREVAARWCARYLLEPVAGLSRARNRGALFSNSEIIAYLDDDAVP